MPIVDESFEVLSDLEDIGVCENLALMQRAHTCGKLQKCLLFICLEPTKDEGSPITLLGRQIFQLQNTSNHYFQDVSYFGS